VLGQQNIKSEQGADYYEHRHPDSVRLTDRRVHKRPNTRG
jgi:hypothetical protein